MRTWVEGRPALGGSPGTPREDDGLAHAQFESWRLMSPLSRRDHLVVRRRDEKRGLFFWPVVFLVCDLIFAMV